MENESRISASMEDYLEAIATLKRENGVARVKDIGRLLNVRNPSVSAALNLLSDAGLVKHERYGYVDLTEKGQTAAHDVIERHKAIEMFLVSILGLGEDMAAADACKMEHAMSKETIDRLTGFVEYAGRDKGKGIPRWLSNFHTFLKTREEIADREHNRSDEENENVREEQVHKLQTVAHTE